MSDDIDQRDGREAAAPITLDRHFSDFVERQVAGGNYRNGNEVVIAGLRLLEEHQRKVEALEAALIEGEMSGPAEIFDNETFVKQMRLRHGR